VRLRTRLVLIIALATLGPLTLLGVGAAHLAGKEIEARVVDAQGQASEGLALYAGTWLDAQIGLLALQVGSVPVAALSDDTRTGFLRLVFQQTAAACVVTLTDADGVDQVPPVRIEPGGLGPAARDRVDDARLSAFRRALPLAALARLPKGVVSGPVLGTPYLPEGRAAPVVPVAVPVPGTDLVVGVELGLDPVASRVAATAEAGPDIALLDANGAVFLAGPRGLVEAGALQSLVSTTAVAIIYETPDGVSVRAATAPVPGTDWTVVVAAPAAEGDQAVQGIQRQTLFLAVLGGVLAVLIGGVYAAQLARPVRGLRDAALAVADGNLGLRVTPGGDAEIADLSRAFNFMSTRLEHNAAEIARKNAEIAATNLELEARVEERTRELREAQERLLQSARLAAVGEMGAGLAHELNNPLAGILGLCQVLVQRLGGSPDAPLLTSLEREARRCTAIVQTLLGFSQELPSPHEGAEDGVVALDALVSEVLALVGASLRQRGVRVNHDVLPSLRVCGDRAELGRALAQLLASVRAAAHGDSHLQLGGHRDGSNVVLDLQLTGAQLRLGGDDWRASGLALWAARRSLSAQGGHLVEPDVDTSTGAEQLMWRVVLPEA
jgi:two-component system, NtrC family, sensor kinase